MLNPEFSLMCEPVDYSTKPQALRVSSKKGCVVQSDKHFFVKWTNGHVFIVKKQVILIDLMCK